MKTYKKHGLSIGLERIDNEFFLTIKAVGLLTHEDYQVIVPMIDSALGGIMDPHVKVLFDMTEMVGWELLAAWDDLKLGLKHGNEFSKIAFYGNKKWQEIATKIVPWFISGEAKYFESFEEAVNWLKEHKKVKQGSIVG